MKLHRKGLYVSSCHCPDCECQRRAILLGTDQARALPPLAPSVVDVGTVTEYGLTQKLSTPIRCF